MADREGIEWRKATRSGNQGGGACVEVGFVPDGSRRIRDTKNRAAGSLALSKGAFAAFLSDVKEGKLDPDK